MDNSFAALVGKLNEIDNGRPITERQFKPTPVTEGLKQNDMTSILENMYKDRPFESAKSLEVALLNSFKKTISQSNFQQTTKCQVLAKY